MGSVSKSARIAKVFNNNVIMVYDENIEKILVGKGIGFCMKAGEDFIPDSKVEKVFTIEQAEHSKKFAQLMEQVEHKTIGLCEEIILMISNELGEQLSERIHIGLTDHIQFMLYRLQNKNEISNPFIYEIQTLYKNEFKVAQKAVDMLRKHTGLDIPEEETGFIALHIYSARKNRSMSETLKFTFLCNSVTELIEDELNLQIDRSSLDYARFITHIRFAIQRTIDSSPIKNELLKEIKKKMKKLYKIAEKVAKLVEEDLGIKVEEDEIRYITLHIARFSRITYML